MITLEELIKIYKPYGATDEQIICQYFVKNHIEDKGIELLSELTRQRAKFLNDKIYYQKEYLMYNKSVFYNLKIPEEVKLDLFNLTQTFLYFRDLNEEELKKCKEYFSKYKITSCPIIFYHDLVLKGIIKSDKKIQEWELQDLENFKKMRDD